MLKSMQLAAILTACLLTASAAPASIAKTKDAGAKPAAAAGKSLHRMDFRVEGASCVACLRRTAQELRDTKGVIKADVSIYKPYWAIVIYDASETNLERMKESIKNEHVKLAEIEDKPISAVPAIIIPKQVSAPSQ